MDKKNYPEDLDELYLQVKQEVGWKCEFCAHEHDPQNHYTLQVHHLIPDKALNERWNLAAACQRCNLRAEAKSKVIRVMLKRWRLYAKEDWLMQQLKAYAQQLREELKCGK